MALTTSVVIKISALLTNTSLDLSVPTDNLLLDKSIDLANGTGANQADMIWHDSFSLVDDASNTHNLYDSGTLKTPLGVALTINKLKFLFIENTSTDANLVIGAAAANPIALFTVSAADSLELPPGGKFIWSAPNADGLDITTNKNLKLLHGGQGTSALVYNIVAIGTSS